MRFAVAGGGAAGLAAALAVARAGHQATVLERDQVLPGQVFDAPRKGIPHFLQPHTFLPRGRRELLAIAPDVLDALLEAGAEEQDVAEKLHGPREPGDEELVYLWVRRPVIEAALRAACAAEPGVELRPGATVAALTIEDGRAAGVGLSTGEQVRADVVVDALGRYRTPPGWPRAAGNPTSCGCIYYSRYFELREGAELPAGPWLLNPRGDLGYLAFNTFRGDNRTFCVILLVPEHDRDLRSLRHESAWMAACAAIRPLDEMTSPDVALPITGVLPMGGLANVLRDGDPGVRGLLAMGDAVCHTNPNFSYGLSLALAQARCIAECEGDDEAYLECIMPEARERYELSVAVDAARTRAMRGEPLEIGRRDGCYPLFSLSAGLATAPEDDLILRRVTRRIGLLDRTVVFDDDAEVHARIERHFARLTEHPPPRPGPPREELLSLLARGGS